MSFDQFEFHDGLNNGLDAMGFKEPTPVQEFAIPVILQQKDLIACAQTGTGKTAAYLLPIINKLSQVDAHQLNTLVIVPTRELAMQIDQSLEGFAYFTPVSSLAIYGGGDGASFEREKRALTSGASIVVATPGKLIQHLNMGYVDTSHIEHLVLDEADRMLDMGFFEDLMRIVSHLPKERQTLLFSATMPPKIRDLASEILIEPEQIDIAISKPAEGVTQAAFAVYDEQKTGLIKYTLTQKEVPSVIIFCSTKQSCKNLERELRDLKLNAEAIHSDLEQTEREDVLRHFRNKEVSILVATDIVSRGIDIENISLVINYDVPNDAEDYVHRIGRTARASSTGAAFTLVNGRDMRKFYQIEELIEMKIPKYRLPESVGVGPGFSASRGGKGGGRGKQRSGQWKGRNNNNKGQKNYRRKGRPKQH